MSTAIAAKAMNIAENTFRKNKSDTLPRNNFSEKNFTDLLDFTISELKFLISYKIANTNRMKSFEEVTEMYRNIFLNYHKHCKHEGWNLFDELKMIVDVMETLDEFGDDDLYTKVIDNILFESALLRDPNTFTIEKYKD